MQILSPEIDVHILSELKSSSSDHAVLDIHAPTEFDVCFLPDSICIPMPEISFPLADLPQDRPLIFMCHHGVRSQQVTEFLRKNGFTNVRNLAGGIDAWAHQDDTNMPRY